MSVEYGQHEEKGGFRPLEEPENFDPLEVARLFSARVAALIVSLNDLLDGAEVPAGYPRIAVEDLSKFLSKYLLEYLLDEKKSMIGAVENFAHYRALDDYYEEGLDIVALLPDSDLKRNVVAAAKDLFGEGNPPKFKDFFRAVTLYCDQGGEDFDPFHWGSFDSHVFMIAGLVLSTGRLYPLRKEFFGELDAHQFRSACLEIVEGRQVRPPII